MKVTPNINSFKYLDTLDDILILHLIDPSLSVLKEQLWSKATSNVDEVQRYDNILEWLPTSQTYIYTELHNKISGKVLAAIFGYIIDQAR